jgi:methionine-rich copper-binding protein CopC
MRPFRFWTLLKSGRTKPRAPRQTKSLRFEPLESRNLLAVLTIAQENALPGTPQSVWDIDGAGSNIEGYAAEMSVNHGETVHFKVNVDTGNYRLDIYRLGYYGGNGARYITTVRPFSTQPQNQPSPLRDSSTGMVDAGNWAISAQWQVPGDATSGVYLAKLVREDGQFGENHIVFVVRDDEGHSDLLFKTSDSTWQAYNSWGGASLYGGNGPGSGGRAYAVSYNRPFNTRETSAYSWLFGSEYPMIRWIESNGYNVSYTTDIDISRAGWEILEHKVFLSVGHDEYWSAEARANVEAARDAGVSLAFFSGNEIFWKTRWENSIDSSRTPFRTLVCYKETHTGAKIDPAAGVWTGTWRDPRFSTTTDGGRPENALTGTLFVMNDNGTPGNSITVPYEYANLRFWRNTSIATMSPGQTATLGTYTLGYEWDEDPDNGFRPAGLFHLSSTNVYNANAKLLDNGSTFGAGSATHHLVMYRAASGALVFGAGTVQWSWGLDGVHDIVTTTPDVRMQQATVNLFADMGVQPYTLRPGLVAATQSTDFLAPISTITTPLQGAVLQPGVPITIAGTAEERGGGVVTVVEVSVDGGLTWQRANGRTSWTYTWTPRTSGTVTIKTRAVDDSGNIETPGAGVTVNPPAPGTTSFTLFGSSTPSIVDSGDGQAVELGMRFLADSDGLITGVRFYKSSANTGQHVANLWTADGTRLATATFTSETSSGWQQVNFQTPVAIQAGKVYIVSYYAPNGRYSVTRDYFTTLGVDNGPLHAPATGPTGVNGLYRYGSSGFPTSTYQSSNYWVDVVFTPTSSAFSVFAITPASNAQNVSPATSVVIQFSQAVSATTINMANIQVRDANGTLVDGLLTYDAAQRTALFTPSQPLANSTRYTVTVKGGASGVKNANGDMLESDFTSSFTVIGAGPFSLWSSSATPSVIDSGDNQAVELGVKFTSSVDGFITGLRFYKSAANTGTHVGHLWLSDGTLLATATFTNETSSGWQQVTFDNPVAIRAGVTYVASYYTSTGRYSVDRNYFNNAVTNGPLQAVANSTSVNGLYRYGGSGFPTSSFSASNYWVDVVLSTVLPPDTTPPTVASITPANGSTGAAVKSTIRITFNEPINPASANTGTIEVRDGNNFAIPGTITYDTTTNTVIFTPAADLDQGATYTVVVKSEPGPDRTNPCLGCTGLCSACTTGINSVRDMAGNPLAQDFVATFKTVADTRAPSVRSISPSNNTAGVSIGTNVYINFSETISLASISATTIYLRDSAGNTVAADLNYDPLAKMVKLTPNALLAEGISYTVVVKGGSAGVKDLAGNALAADLTSTFTTAGVAPSPPADTTPPSVVSVTPANNATGVSTMPSIVVTFSEALSATSVSAATVFLRNASNAQVSTNLVYNATNRTVTLTPVSALANSAVYTVVVQGGSSGVKDLAGNALAATWTSSFTTVAASSAPATNSADTKPPGVKSVSPSNGASSVATTTSVFINFSEALDLASVNASTIFLRDAGGTTVQATLSYNASTFVVTLQPLAALANSTTYTVTIKGGASGVKDLAGNAVRSDVTSSFATVSAPVVDTTPPSVTAIAPPANATGVPTNTSVTITFSETLSASSVNATTVLLRDASNNQVPVNIVYNATNRTVTLTPTSSLANLTTYTVVAKGGASGIKDAAGNAMTADFTSSFTTAAPVADTQPPSIQSFSPTKGSTGVSNTTSIVVNFSEAIDLATLNASTLQFRNAANLAVPYTISYNAATNTLTLTPSSPLAYSTTYTLIVKGGANGIKDLAGNAMTADNTLSFTTRTAPTLDTKGPGVRSISPTNGNALVAVATSVYVNFSETLDAATVNTSTIVLTDANNVQVTATVIFDASTNQAILTPSSPLAYSMTYRVLVKGGASGVKDLSGNALSADIASMFTTVSL